MSYLERNSRMIAEVAAELPISKGEQRGSGGIATFHSAGSYNSAELETEIYVGLKQDYKNDPEQLRDRFIFELAVMSVIAQNLPHLLPDLPLFYGLVIGKNGEPTAIVTEDFSRDGENRVEPSRYVPVGIEELFEPGTLDGDKIEHISFAVWPIEAERKFTPSGELIPVQRAFRLGDFYPLLFWGKRDEHKTRFPEKQIEEQLDKYTVRINHDL